MKIIPDNSSYSLEVRVCYWNLSTILQVSRCSRGFGNFWVSTSSSSLFCWRIMISCLTHLLFFLLFRHEKPTDPSDPLADQNIKDRFYGINDPVADKLLRRYDSLPKLDLPEDRAVSTLYVGNLADRVSEKDLRYLMLHRFHRLCNCTRTKLVFPMPLVFV